TSRQVGSTLGVAVLGTFVVQQFSGTIAFELAQRGVPRTIGATIASQLAGAGAQASRVHLAGRLPLQAAHAAGVADTHVAQRPAHGSGDADFTGREETLLGAAPYEGQAQAH